MLHGRKTCVPCVDRTRARYRRLRAAALAHYGNACACCGETLEAFLCIDHVNGDGEKRRKYLDRNHTAIYGWLQKHNYPDDFQILCYNCNHAKAKRGVCPHQQAREGAP